MLACGAWSSYVWTVEYERTGRDPLLYDSALASLQAHTGRSLAMYYGEHGEFPTSLSDITYPPHEEEFTDEMFRDLAYETDGQSFTLVVTYEAGHVSTSNVSAEMLKPRPGS
jgi:hypothetical protein